MRSKQRGFTVKELLIVIVLIAVVLGGGSLWLFGDSKGNLMFQGARMSETEASAAVSVPAAGTDLRSYSFVDAFGRVCTGVYSNESGSWGDCEFPPQGWEAPAR